MMRSVVVAVSLLLGSVASAGGSSEGRVLVLDMGGSGVAPELARSLSDVLVSAVRDELPGRDVVSQADIKAMLDVEMQKDLIGCDESSCYAEIGGALGAERIVAGSLGRVGALYVVTVRLIDAARGQVERNVSDRVDGKEDILVEAVSQLGRSLMDPARPYGQGYVQVREAGTLKIDGQPRRAPLDRVAVGQGSHEFELEDADGDSLWKQAVEIPPYQLTLLAAPVGPAWYTRWWVWTGAAVVLGGAAAAYVATRPGPGPSSGDLTVTLHP